MAAIVHKMTLILSIAPIKWGLLRGIELWFLTCLLFTSLVQMVKCFDFSLCCIMVVPLSHDQFQGGAFNQWKDEPTSYWGFIVSGLLRFQRY